MEDIPCYVSDYFLIACVAKGTAATSADAAVHGVMGAVGESVSETETVYGLKSPDGNTLERINTIDEGHSSYKLESGDSFSGSGSTAKCAAQINASLGFGCDVSVSPVVRRGDADRPRQVRVFGATLSASCEWNLVGSGQRGREDYTEWESERVFYDENTGEETIRTVYPRPAGNAGTAYSETIAESCAASWDSGLVVWDESGVNRITADHTEIDASFWTSAARASPT